MSKPNNLEKRILVIDDELNDLKLIAENLSDFYRISVMNNTSDALDLIKNGAKFHYIITDLLMPKQKYNGTDLIQSLKSEDCPIPVIAMSGLARREDSAKAVLDGAIFFIDKDRIKAPQNQDALNGAVVEIESYVKKHKDERKDIELLRMKVFNDHTTQLYNIAKFDIDIKNEIARHSRRVRKNIESVFSLLYIDINNMKEANDNLGHEYVDQNLLKNLGDVIRHRRKSDFGYRKGGDEFIVILPDTDEVGAIIAANSIISTYDNLRKKYTYDRYESLVIRSENVKIGEGVFETLRDNTGTLSIGIAQAPLREPLTRENLLSWGEDAMYTAKKIAKSKNPIESIVLAYRFGMDTVDTKENSVTE